MPGRPGATVILNARSRSEILAAILARRPAAIRTRETAASARLPRSIPSWWPISGPWAYCRLQVELLARQRHYTSGLDEPALERELVAAARAAVEGDTSRRVAG